MHTKNLIVLFRNREISGVQRNEMGLASVRQTMKTTEAMQNEE